MLSFAGADDISSDADADQLGRWLGRPHIGLPGRFRSLQRAQGGYLGKLYSGFGEHQLALSPSGARRWLVQSPLNCQNPLADGDSGLWVCHLPVDTAEVKGTEPVGSSDVVEVYRRYAAAGKSR